MATNYISEFDDPLRALLSDPNYQIGSEGKIHWNIDNRGLEQGYIHYNAGSQVYCHYWLDIYCKYFRVIPAYCRAMCWKTVVKLPDVESLMQFENIMKKLDLPSKLGADTREFTFGCWVAFFYDTCMNDGHQTYDLICRQIEKHMPEEKQKHIKCFLKRGCTEMEAICPSKQWDTLDGSHYEKERMLDRIFYFSEKSAYYNQGAWFKDRVRKRWVQLAIQIGDKSILNCLSQDAFNSMIVSSAQYQDSRPRNPDKVFMEADKETTQEIVMEQACDGCEGGCACSVTEKEEEKSEPKRDEKGRFTK